MISGIVNAALEPSLPLVFIDASGLQSIGYALFDSGFDGDLVLPPSQIAQLGWPWLRQNRALLAGGNVTVINVYLGTLLWDGNLRQVEAMALDGDLLVGTELMRDHNVFIEFIDGGMVTVQSRSVP